jgi:MFS transporter, DHA2 family, multidrug resistance protein
MSEIAEPRIKPTVIAAGIVVSPWPGFLLMCLGMFMAILDIQVVATSLPAIKQAFEISADAMSWIQTAYLIAEVIAIPLTGLFTRVLSLRWLFVAAIILFTAASLGCAFSTSFDALIGFRVVQGFAGGMLIPVVFSAVFLLFPVRLHAAATTVGGVVAVLAPTVGPVVGGWITDTWSWHWLFLINVAPGIVAAATTPFLLPRQPMHLAALRKLDGISVLLAAAALACLELGLKDAPHDGWLSLPVTGFFMLSVGCGMLFVCRSLCAADPVVDLTMLRRRSFAIGCGLSFCLGVGLFGSVYLMPVFLAFVRGHDAFAIGSIMLVTGAAQLLTAPLAGALDSRVSARLLTGFGFAVFAAGLGLSALQSRTADFDEMVWPQLLRGVAIMFCLLPPMRLALGSLAEAEVPDASGLFNLMRNLGGAIGIALIDTILYARTETHADDFRLRLLAGDSTAAQAIGLSQKLFDSRPPGPPDAQTVAYIRPLVEKAALALSVNEAWAMLAAVALMALLLACMARETAG